MGKDMDVIAMKQYLRYFKWPFVAVGALAVVYIGLLVTHSATWGKARGNGECRTEERVFDYGGVLSEEEEENLRKLIDKKEKQTGCDIVLVTLNESLKEYAREREANVPYREFVRVFAEEFYDSNAFGYDKPIGDGVILVDNWYREDDGRIYTWLCTVGRAEEKYTDARVNRLLDNVYRYIEEDPYKAYETYINDFGHDMTGSGMISFRLPRSLPPLAAVISMATFVILHWSYKKGKKTVSVTAYIKGKPQLYNREDIFLNKRVTRRTIQRNTGGGRSGGGGGGASHGGHHGGGGRSR